VIGLAMTIFGADLERSLPILRSCYFIADSADLVRILVMEKSDPTKTVETGNVGIRHPQPKLSWLAQSLSANFKQFEYLDSTRSVDAEAR